MTRSKRHHTVPEVLQKHFGSSDGKIWYSKREAIGESFAKPEHRTFRASFWRRHYNTIYRSEGPTDVVERRFWGAVDDYLGRLLPSLIESTFRNKIPIFREEALSSLNAVCVLLSKRSFDAFHHFDDHSLGVEIVEETNKEISKRDGLEAGAKGQSLDHPPEIYLGREARIIAQTTHSEGLVEAFDDYTVVFVRPEPGSAFVLGSKMLYRTTSGCDSGLGSKDFELWFPISKHLALVRCHASHIEPTIVEMPRDRVRRFNESIVHDCLEVGSHSERLLKSLIRRI